MAAVMVTGGLAPLGAGGQAFAAPPSQTAEKSPQGKAASALTEDAATDAGTRFPVFR
ncbi:hypothetical protein ACIOC1_28495 [Streptomyces sp. NPDC088197]|uniref:hypothetical protein n=1 Tax=Streptomyces sp. NPDC088197 TaxID=3365840 RepID=UPI00380B655A